ncbi:MAG: GNAT family N-acetyltransferase [Rubripirellula sp.]|nr:GNAT family N-acetyltransferase [Rubripirellula sp.]
MQTRLIQSRNELQQLAPAWNRLLANSDTCLPTLRAEVLAHWLRHFCYEHCFRAILVEDGHELVAALPLIQTRKAGFLPVATLPGNAWAETANLLVARNCDTPTVCDALAAEIRAQPEALLWMDGVRYEQSGWRELVNAMNRQKSNTVVELQYHVGLIEIENDWESYHSRLSKGFRKKMRKATREAKQQGELEYISMRNLDASQIRNALQAGFEVEHKSWKSSSRTSVLATEGMLEYYIESAEILAQAGEMEILNLQIGGNLVAFEMGYVSQGTYFSFKVGYDSQYAKLSPGQLLVSHQLESYNTNQDRRWIDAIGVMSDATAKWATHSIPKGRMILSTGRCGNQLIKTYRNLMPTYRELRKIKKAVPDPILGAGPRRTSAIDTPLAIETDQPTRNDKQPGSGQQSPDRPHANASEEFECLVAAE